MANTSVSLGDHFSGFISRQVSAGRYKNASEVMRAALRLLEEHEERRAAVRRALEEGLDSGVAEGWEVDGFLARMKAAHGAGG